MGAQCPQGLGCQGFALAPPSESGALPGPLQSLTRLVCPAPRTEQTPHVVVDARGLLRIAPLLG
ncbi:hypothetical protein HUA74_07490 [Myxococcus sp. CA051A]|uniref:hypothetical protein n=1 Tax=Myxococcus sp. CA051A TaxID=2741739 RepID=UPI00157AF935|nr:hypothetical protein [Myxococcus sp. CA051A]NTX60501.1 hypothetical protein [Myxococcus sp. CA051A]